MDAKKTIDRLTYIEPNEYAGLNALRNNRSEIPGMTSLSWNPEELAMFVDLQVVIPNREDAGQVSYLVNVDGGNLQFDTKARRVSYMEGIPYNKEINSQSVLTDNYTNISYSEVANGKVVDKESLGITSIDINFDAHFFPLVTINFTDVRGSSLFMVSEEEFKDSLKKETSNDTVGSFFKALFHFPYPRFLLSVKGFYGTKVTFQLAVSDFKSGFNPENGNFDMTIQFIGYVYGLYTDLPFDLILASPYYNKDYWMNQVRNGVFKYVSSNGESGGDMLTYVEFLRKVYDKKIDNTALQNSPETAAYIKAKKVLPELAKIPDLYKKLCESEIPEECKKWYSKRSSGKNTFIWGVPLSTHGGFYFNLDAAKNLYKQLQIIFRNFPEYKEIVEENNIFLQSFYKQARNGVIFTYKTIAEDTECNCCSEFSNLISATLKQLKNTDISSNASYFVFNSSKPEIIENRVFYEAVGDDKYMSSQGIFEKGSDISSDGITKLKDAWNQPSETLCCLIKIEDYVNQFKVKLTELENLVNNYENKITDELKKAYANVLGFEPTVENYYRMLFAHIDCFMQFYFEQILKQVKQDEREKERTLEYLGISESETDVPKRFSNIKNKNELSVFPFPAYYTTHGTTTHGTKKQIQIADFPGYASGLQANFSKIVEVDAVNRILNGIREFNYDMEANVYGNGIILSNVFSPLSILYGFKNPWDSLELSKTNDEEDIFHIIYFFICLAYADKLIGTDLDREIARGEDDKILTYQQQLAKLLYKNIGEHVSLTFIEKLKYALSAIKGAGGMKYILNNLKDTYKLYELDASDDGIRITKYNSATLKVTDEILRGPVEYTDYEDSNYVVKPSPQKQTGKASKFAIGDDYFLSGYSKEQLKEYSEVLNNYAYVDPYLAGRVKKTNNMIFGETRVRGYIDLGKYNPSFFYDNLRYFGGEFDWTRLDYIKLNPFVGFNEDIYVPLQTFGDTDDTKYLQTGQATMYNLTMDGKIIHCVEHGYDVCRNVASSYYLDGGTTGYMPFVGRREPGTSKKEPAQLRDDPDVYHDTVKPSPVDYMSDENRIKVQFELQEEEKHQRDTQIDSYPSVNLFSGAKKIVTNDTTSVEYDNAETQESKRWKFNEEIISKDSEENYKGLLYTRKCLGLYEFEGSYLVPDWESMTDESKKIAKYAFATYLAASLAGPNLNTIVDSFKRDTGKIPTLVSRKVDLLYLGGSLYFAKDALNDWTKRVAGNIDKYIICDLLTGDGTIRDGLRKMSDSILGEIPEYAIDVTWMFKNTNGGSDELLADKLIKYFTDWCDTELFGGLNMYDKLSKVPAEIYDDEHKVIGYTEPETYTIMNGYTAYNDGCDDRYYCLTVGYTVDGVCEKWLRNLALSYEYSVLFTSLLSRTYNKKHVPSTIVTKNDIVSFLETFFEPLKKRLDDEEKKKKALENGTALSLPEDQRRATYYLLKNLYDKWLCSYTFNDFKLHKPEIDLQIRDERFSKLNTSNNSSEYNNFIYIDQFYNDISSTFIMDTDTIAKKISDVYRGKTKLDIYGLMSFMAETNNLMLLALPVYTNMYRPDNVERIFTPNTLYNINSGDNCNGVGTTYVIMYTNEASHHPCDFYEYDYNRDYIDIADVLHNHTECADLVLFSTNGKNKSDLNYDVTAFGVSYGKQNQMYFKRVNVSMDNPKVTDESIRNMLILADGGSSGDTDQPISNGQNIYSIYSNRSYTCTVEMMGCANIMPLMYFQLNNIPMFRGLYLIINVSHSIKAGDMTTTFTGVRVSRYSLPDIKDVILNSSIFKRISNSGAWKTGGPIACESDCLNLGRVAKFKKTIKENQYMKDFVKQMLKLGWPKAVICGIGGACGCESNFEYWLVNEKEFNGNDSQSKANATFQKPYIYGAGLIQWSLDRKKTLVENVTNESGVKLYKVHGSNSAEDFLISKVPSLMDRRTRIAKPNNLDGRISFEWTGGIENFTMAEQTMCIDYELTHNLKQVGNTLKQLTTNDYDTVDKATYTVYTKYVAFCQNTPGVSTKEDACSVSCKYSSQFGETTGIEKRVAYAEWMFANWDKISK